MIRMIQISTAKHAQSYFAQDLRGNNYYSQGTVFAPEWGGQLAVRLGLAGAVQAQAFNRLCNNRHPETNEPLTPRTKKTKRTVAYDLNFHPPKSVSLLLELTDDNRLETVFREAVTETLARIEGELQTRVRLNGQKDTRRDTGNACYALFYHHTSRPIDGQPDPHLHIHAIVFNLTHDPVEDRIKAAHFRRSHAELPYYQACFQSALARKVKDLGYNLRTTPQGWEIAGVSDSLIRRFSRRSEQIEAEARKRGLSGAAKDALGARLRDPKIPEQSRTELRIAWRARISAAEYAALEALRDPQPRVHADLREREVLPERADRLLLGEALMYRAIAHHFEREAVVSERRLQTTALRFGHGQIAAEDLPLLSGLGLLIREREGQRLCTTSEAIHTETQILRSVREQKGKHPPLAPHLLPPPDLNEGQAQALNHLLQNRDGIFILEGKAGTGKTSLLKSFREALETTGIPYAAVAPTAEAAREVLRAEGFTEADTLAAFLLQDSSLRGGVLIVDEAGLVGAKTMRDLLQKASDEGFRVLLCGDRGQHGAVERKDILSTLMYETGVVPATLYDIRRQSGSYRAAVQALSQGRMEEGFKRLVQNGCLHEIPDPVEREQAVIASYLHSLKRPESVLLIAPTHAEGDRLTAALRTRLKEEQLLKGRERVLERLVPTNWTEAERKDGLNYEQGMVIELIQNVPGYRKGQRLKVAEVSPQGQVYVWLKEQEGGRPRLLDLSRGQHFKVCRRADTGLQVGDVIRIGQNGKSHEGSRLTTGSLRQVKGFSKAGDPLLDTGVSLPANYGHWSYGWVSTSHAAQGKTCDHVIICQSTGSAEQFYVSVSRGRRQVSIFTEDQEKLQASVLPSVPQLSATDLLRGRSGRKEERLNPVALLEQSLYEDTARIT